MTTKTHLHQFDVHQNPDFQDMAHCVVCRWGVSKAALLRSLHRASARRAAPDSGRT